MPEVAKEPSPLMRRAGWSSTNKMIALFIAVDIVTVAIVVAVFVV